MPLSASRSEFSRTLARDRITSPAQLRMEFEGEVVVNFENQGVDSHVRELAKILAQRLKICVAVVVKNMHGAPLLRAL